MTSCGFLLVSFHSGPAAQFYATIPKGVVGLGAGAYGETGRGIQEYHELIANHGTQETTRSSSSACVLGRTSPELLYVR